MSDPFDIQRIGPPVTDGIPRTSKKGTGIQKEDIATESHLDAVERRESEERKNRRKKESKTEDPPSDSDSSPTKTVIDIVI